MERKPGITPFEQKVIDKIRTLRTKRKMSQRDLSLLLGDTDGDSFVGLVEGYTTPHKYNIRHLNLIALIFKVPVSSLLPRYGIVEDTMMPIREEGMFQEEEPPANQKKETIGRKPAKSKSAKTKKRKK